MRTRLFVLLATLLLLMQASCGRHLDANLPQTQTTPPRMVTVSSSSEAPQPVEGAAIPTPRETQAAATSVHAAGTPAVERTGAFVDTGKSAVQPKEPVQTVKVPAPLPAGQTPVSDPPAVVVELGPTPAVPVQPVAVASVADAQKETVPGAKSVTQRLLDPNDVRASRKVQECEDEESVADAGLPEFSAFTRTLRAHARATYRQVLNDFPTSAAAVDASMSLARMAEEEHDWAAGAVAYERVVSDFPESPEMPEAQYGLAKCQAAMRNYEQARTSYLNLADGFPRHRLAPVALLAAGECLEKLGDTEGALKEYHALEAAKSGTASATQACQKAATLLAREQRHAEAIETLKRGILSSARELRPQLTLQLADICIEGHELEQARDALARLLASQGTIPVRIKALRTLARAYDEGNEPLNAARALLQAAKEEKDKPDNGLAYRLRAAQHFLAAQFPGEALEQLRLLLGRLEGARWQVRDKLEPQALLTAAKAARLCGKPTDGDVFVAELRKRYPDSPLAVDTLFEEADALAQQGKSDEAIEVFRKIINAHGKSPHTMAAILRIAELQERSGNKVRGPGLYEELAAASNDDAQSAHFKLRRALVMQELGALQDAHGALSALVADKQTPREIGVMARYHRALLDQRAGRTEAAVAGYEDVIRLGAQIGEARNKELAALVEDAKWKIPKLKWVQALNLEPTAWSESAGAAMPRL